MADKDQEPSLELPSLGFGRRKKRAKGGSAPEAPETPAPLATPEPLAPELAEPGQPAEPAEPVEASKPLYVDEAPTQAQPAVEAEPEPTRVQPAVATEPTPAPQPESQPAAPAKPKRDRPLLTGFPAAMVTGLLIGVLTVGLTAAGFRLCEVVQGTPSCGNPGFLLLVAIMVLMVWLGAVLLRTFGEADPGSTSFLAVGLLAVLALLFLVDELFSWWMIIVIPLISLATYALSHWVTTAFVDPAEH